MQIHMNQYSTDILLARKWEMLKLEYRQFQVLIRCALIRTVTATLITKQMQARISHTKSMEIEISESAFHHVTSYVL